MRMASRPTVNLDALGALLDRALAHPFAGLVEQVLPQSVARVREARADLPAALGLLQERSLQAVGTELDALVADAIAGLGPKRRRKDP
jgi:hypothetical protein